jgi:ppGpp synthetase/RelA/SpoT-type nucleotidyltranferase
MMAALRQTPISQICYAFRSRVKTEDRLIEKKARKLPEKPEYKLEDITDVIGVGCGSSGAMKNRGISAH